MSFTPGPWHVSDLDGRTLGPVRVLRAEGDVPQLQAVARVMNRTGEWQANACLLAAAPELYQALKAAVEWLPDPRPHRLTDPEGLATVIAQCRAAVQKAEGTP